MVKAVASRNSGQWLVTCGQWGRVEEWKTGGGQRRKPKGGREDDDKKRRREGEGRGAVGSGESGRMAGWEIV